MKKSLYFGKDLGCSVELGLSLVPITVSLSMFYVQFCVKVCLNFLLVN